MSAQIIYDSFSFCSNGILFERALASTHVRVYARSRVHNTRHTGIVNITHVTGNVKLSNLEFCMLGNDVLNNNNNNN